MNAPFLWPNLSFCFISEEYEKKDIVVKTDRADGAKGYLVFLTNLIFIFKRLYTQI